MKKDIHPELHPVVFVDSSCNEEFVTLSTLTSEETREINGVEHFVIHTEISSGSHPFYTGKQVFLDTARRLEKFEARMKKQEAAAKKRKGKKAKQAARAAAKQEEEENTSEEEKPVAKQAEKVSVKAEKEENARSLDSARDEAEEPKTPEAPAVEEKQEA